jgi:hypothetical protein
VVGNNCLFIAVSALLERAGTNIGPDLIAFALRLRYTAAAHVLDNPGSADPPPLADRARVVAAVNDKARSVEMARSLRSGQALDASYITIISSVLGLAFEVLVIDPASAIIAPHNVRFISSKQGPQYAPIFAGTLALFDGHWYPVAAGT